MALTILVVDDEKDILKLLKYNLENEGYRVLTAHDGKEALKVVKQHPSLVILDIMMPELDRWEVCKAIRKDPATSRIPIIILTARDSDVEDAVGLERGAVDYIVKPLRIRTVVARVKRALRPASEREKHSVTENLTMGDLEIQTAHCLVRIKNRKIHLPKKEFEVLLYLARHPERVVSRETLLREVWGHDVYVVDRTIDVHVRKIRSRLGRLAEHIETVKGVGYRFRREF